jgi:methylthioribulose-1-phosphate dehydratase
MQDDGSQVRREAAEFNELATEMAGIVRDFYRRGWTLGTSGNFSAVICQEPLRLAITSTGIDKGTLGSRHFLQVDAEGNLLEGEGRASAETLVHLITVRLSRARIVMHTHSVWSTVLSHLYANQGGLSIKGFEMLKGLKGVTTHEHCEWVPIIENSQNWKASTHIVEEIFRQHPASHAFLIRGHGLYTWGQDLAEAKRHVEIFEFLFEVTGRLLQQTAGGPSMASLNGLS